MSPACTWSGLYNMSFHHSILAAFRLQQKPTIASEMPPMFASFESLTWRVRVVKQLSGPNDLEVWILNEEDGKEYLAYKTGITDTRELDDLRAQSDELVSPLSLDMFHCFINATVCDVIACGGWLLVTKVCQGHSHAAPLVQSLLGCGSPCNVQRGPGKRLCYTSENIDPAFKIVKVSFWNLGKKPSDSNAMLLIPSSIIGSCSFLAMFG